MVFSSIIFLFFFLPIVVVLHWLAPRSLRNTILLSASLFFYAWGEGLYTFLMLASICANWMFAILVSKRLAPTTARWLLWLGIAVNLGMLAIFKYSNFMIDNLNTFLGIVGLTGIYLNPVHLPIGISFFTFQAMSYVIDVYRGVVPPQNKISRLGLYISLFPQLVAGPIVRYTDIVNDLSNRSLQIVRLGRGVERFIMGLGKKVLIANPAGAAADAIFALDVHQLSPATAWIGAVSYTLQIYFDFSGYSDMAIGIGHMLGFTFPENFRYPYIATSITEFWRRWHMSLSTWFRDYLYIPLGGNRVSRLHTYGNLVTVFVLCGLWHGASWNFVVWGLFHGSFLVFERMGLKSMLQSFPRVLQHIYTAMVFTIGWVFFRTESLGHASDVLRSMFLGHIGTCSTAYGAAYYLNGELVSVWMLGVICAAPVFPWAREWLHQRHSKAWQAGKALLFTMSLAAIMLGVTVYLVAGTHNPFIYFRF